MPSRRITVSTWASESAASVSMRCMIFFHASASPPTPLPEKPLPMVVPPLTPPPLRVEAPTPKSPRSRTVTSMPERASSRAVDRPPYPAPTTSTSVLRGGSCDRSFDGCHHSHHQGIALKSLWNTLSAMALPSARAALQPAPETTDQDKHDRDQQDLHHRHRGDGRIDLHQDVVEHLLGQGHVRAGQEQRHHQLVERRDEGEQAGRHQ